MVRLIDAPVGLFRDNNTLAMKTEYSTPHQSEDGTVYTPDCYIVSSGEYFWGGVHTAEERNEILVEPIPLHRVYIMGQNLSKAKGGEDLGEPVTSCTAESGRVYTISPEGWVE